MAFDVQAALKEGYSKAEIADYLASQSKFDANAARKEGYSDDEILAHLSTSQKPKERTWTEAAGDTGLDLAKGVVGLGESVVGLADLVTGNLVGKGLDAIGYDPEETKRILSSGYSDSRQAANKNVADAKGFWNTAEALIDNPSAAVGSMVESAPMMIGSAAAVRAAAAKMLAARGIAAGTPEAAALLNNPATVAKLTAIGSGAEGAMTAGNIQEQGRQAGRDWTDTAPSAVAGGATTALIGFGTSKIPGFKDAEVGAAVAGMGGSAQRQSLLAAGKEIAKGTFKEGVLEELPQSAQEQVFTNLASGKPWDEGVAEAAAQGMVAGAGMGGGMSTYAAGRNALAKDAPQPTTTDLTGDGRIEPNAANATKSTEDAQIDTALAETKQQPAQPPASPAQQMGEAREVELWAKASDGTITPEEKAELAAMQQGQPAQPPAADAMPSAPEQLPPDVATPAPVDTRHPTEQAADAVVAALAQEAGIPIETVLPPSTAQQATPLPEAGASQPVNLPAPQPGAESGALPVNTLAQASEVPSMASPAVEIPARPRTEKEARALRAQQQEISNATQAAEAQQAEAQGSERQQAPAPKAEQVAPKTEREAREQRRKTEILTPDGKKVAAQWDVVEADSIKASLKEGVSQPRDRTRAASNAQVLEIAGKPDFERLSDTSKTMDYGAPTLSADGLIVGGNGRFEGVSRAYDGPTATAYRAAVEQAAPRFGLDADAIRGMKKPVLVRRITDNADTRQLAIQSNQAAGLQMSDMEQAALDSERMKALDQIEVSDTGDIPLTSRNMQAIQQTLAGYSTNELAGMMTADGGLSQSGMRRLRNAILFSAYGKSDTLARLIESPDADMKNVGTALVRAAGRLAKVRTGIAEGGIPEEFDIAADLTAAIETLSGLRAEGKRLDEFLAQGDMFGGGLSQSERAIITFLADNLRSAKAITEGLAGYAERVLSTQNSSGGLFGDAPLPTKTEVLNDATKRFADERAAAQSQQSIFDQPAPELHADTTGGNREVQAGESGDRPDAGRQSGDEAAREPESRAGADAGNQGTKPTGVDHASDFALRPVEIAEHLIATGDIKALYKAAGVKTADAFAGLPMDERSAAYAKFIENGGKPAPAATEAYNDKVARQEREALIRRLQSDATVRQASGKPFKTEASAKEFSAKHELDDTHEPAKVEAGYVLKRLPEARRPSVLKAQAERLANDPEHQRQERAFDRATKIGAAASDAVTAYENGDTSIEQFESALTKAEKVGAGGTATKLEEQGDDGYTDPYELTETRLGTTDAQREAGRSALSDLRGRFGLRSLQQRSGDALRGKVSVLGLRLIANFSAGRPNALIGQHAESARDLAALAQVYRDPRFETFRVAYLEGNKIVGEIGYTSRLPGAVIPPQDLDAKIAQGMARFGADGFYILHNHPSGKAQPSTHDERLTIDMAAFVSGFRGHVVIDHNEYAVIDREGRSKVIQDETLNGIDFTGKPAVPHKLLGQVLSNPRAVAGFAKELQTPQGHATLVLATRPGEVQLIVDVPMGALNDTSRQGILKGKALIRRMARDSGSSGNRFIILPDGVDMKALGVWAREGVFTDVVSADGVSYRETTTDPVKRDFIDDGRAMEVRENSDEKDGYIKDGSRSSPNANVGDVSLVVDERTADGISTSNGGLLSRGDSAGAAPSIEQVEQVYGQVMDGLKNAPLGKVVQSTADLPFDAPSDVKGVFWKGSIYLVADNLGPVVHGGNEVAGASVIRETIAHEMIGHYGLRGFFGAALDGVLNRIHASNPRVQKLAYQWKQSNQELIAEWKSKYSVTDSWVKARSIEEALAGMAERGEKLKGWKNLAAMLQTLLRKMGATKWADSLEAKTDAEALLALKQAEMFVKRGLTKASPIPDAAYPLFVRASNQPPLGLTGGKPASPQPELPGETPFRFVQRRVQDKLNRFTVIKDWLAEQGVKLSELADVYKAEERMHSRFANKAEGFREKRVKPLVEKIQAAGFSMDDVAQFLHAQHAQERNAQVAKVNQDRPDGGSGMTDAEAKAILSKASPELAKLANEFRAIADDTLAILVNSGMVSKEQAAAYRAAYQHYVPLKGGPDDGSQTGTGKGLSARHKIKRALGHEMREGGEWVIENILADHQRAIMLAEKNRVGIHLLNMAVEAGRDDLLTIDKPKKRQVLKENVAYEVLHKGQVIGTFDSQEAARLFRGQAMSLYKSSTPSHFSIRRTSDPAVILMASPMPADNEVIVYVHGHEIRVQINDELLARAYKNMGAEAMNFMVRVGAGLNAFFSRIYTGYNPEFIVTNIVRDFTTGLANITGEQGVAMAGKAAKNYAARFVELFKYAYTGTETKWVKMYREDGGNTGAAYLTDLERLGKEIQTEYAAYRGVTANLKDGDYKNAARAAGRKVFDKSLVWIERLNQAGENAMRLAVYQAMIESGRTRNEAASAAKNATVNFNRKGELGQQANALWLFFNAGVQGTAAIAHAHAKGKHRKQAWAFSSTLMGLGYLLSLAAAGDDEDKYEKTSEYERSRNLLIKTGDGFVKIPLPYGYGFFWNMGRGMADAQRTGELGKMPWHVAASFVEEFTPFGATVAGKEPSLEQAFLYAMPTVGQIAGAPIMNRSGMGGDLMPDSKFDPHQPDREKMSRATRGTMADDVAGALESAGLDVSPETVKHLARTFTGGAGSFAQSAVDLSILKAAGADVEVKEIPFIRKFYTVPDVHGARGRYYEAKTEAEKALSELNRARKTMDADKVSTVVDEQYEMIRMAKLAERWSKMTGAARDRADAIRLTGTYTKAEERAIIRQMERDEEAMYDEYMSYFKEAKREAKQHALEREAAAR